MLTTDHATEATDRQIASLFSRWTDTTMNGGDPPPFTRSLDHANELRSLMERSGRRGQIRTVTIYGAQAFFYVCRSPSGPPFALGVGSTRELAICDAFRQCRPDAG